MSSHPAELRDGGEASLVKQALAALRNFQEQLDEAHRKESEPIAILGMGCRYPGAEDPEALWQLLVSGEDAITEIPEERSKNGDFDRHRSTVQKILPSRRGGFLAGLERMDAAFFGISPREAPHVDPRQRILMEIAWEALENAGIVPERLAGSQTGVFIASLTSDYGDLLFEDLRRAEIYSGAGTANSVLANRLSYFFDLHGPSMALDTACSGSLLAVHLACESLRRGESSLALAGGVSVNLMVKSNVFFARAGALSPSGLCRTFDANADGIVRSDGAGVLVLKRLSAAMRDGDPVLAVIRGSAINHDGRSNGIMAPNGEAQRKVLTEAYRRAGVAAGTVQYIELHGTGTPLGDPIEAQALLDVLGSERSAGQKCLVGSLKSNVGHTEAAAGVGGIIKTVLAMSHRQVPGAAHFEKLNPMIPFEGTAFSVPERLEPWPELQPEQRMLAGVSGFGFGGTNAHVVLEEAPKIQSSEPGTRPAYLLPVSAANLPALTEMAANLADRIEKSPDALSLICNTAATRRTHFACRTAAVGSTREELVASLRLAAGNAQMHCNSAPLVAEQGRLAFVFSGQGSHWPGMGRQLYLEEPVFRNAMNRCEALLRDSFGWSTLEAVSELEGNDTSVVQPAIFSIQVALGELWRSWGILPDYVVGHSLGEAAAAHFAGALSLEDAMRVVVLRSRLMKRAAGRGKTAVVGMTLAQAEELVRGLEPDLAVAGSNSPSASVLAGTPKAIDQLLKELEARGVFCREVAGVDIAFHSPQMEPLRQELTELLSYLTPAVESIPIISTVTGALLPGERMDAAYWGSNLRQPFLFTRAVEELLRLGCSSFVEVSPHAVLSSSVVQTAKAHGSAQVTVLPSLKKGMENELRGVYATLAGLYEQGRQVDWSAVYPERTAVVALPHYPWQRERYWFDQLDQNSNQVKESAEGPCPTGTHPLLGARIDAAFASPDGASVTLWQTRVSAGAPGYLADHRVQGEVMMPGAAWIEMMREAAEQVFGGPVLLSKIAFDAPLWLNTESRELQLVLSRHSDTATIEIVSRVPRGEWLHHARASVSGDVPPQKDEISSALNRCTRAVTAEAHYGAMQQKGLEYGPAFRLLTNIVAGESEAVAEILLPESSVIAGYGIHPAMLDAALQLAAAAQEESSFSYLPVAVNSFAAFTRIEQPVQCHLLLRGTPGDMRLEADLRLIGQDGRLKATLNGLTLQRLEPRRASAIDWKESLICERWIAQPRPAQQRTEEEKWLLFAGKEELAEALAFRLAERGQRATLVRPGAQYRQVHESCFEISTKVADVQRLLREDEWTGVALLPGSGQAFVQTAEEQEIAGCALALVLTQSLLATESKAVLRLIVRGSQAVVDTEKAANLDPWQAPLSGFSLAVALENPELQVSLIDLSGDRDSSDAEELAEELLYGGEEVRVALRGSARFVSRLEASDPINRAPLVHNPLRADATYLITGGLGSLGWMTTERLVQEGARHLVLTSRNATESPAVETLRAQGATVVLAACDLSDAAAVDNLFNVTLAQLPPLRGIIHSAGVVEDALLPQQTIGSFRRVMAAKVQGAWNLHQRSQEMPLDFFLLYSSAASLIGSGGQANYAAANSFLDALAHHRRMQGLAAVSLNWGAWSGPGMAARPEVLERLKAQGIATISAEDGLDLLSAILAGAKTPAQLGVFPAEWSKFAAQLPGRLRARLAKMIPSAVIEPVEHILDRLAVAPAASANRILSNYLQRVLAQVLGYKNDAELNPQSRFFDLGMDSLTAIEFRNRLQEDLRIKLSTTLAFDYPEINSLAQYLAASLAPQPAVAADTETDNLEAASETEQRAALDGHTSDELARLLIAELEEDRSYGR